MNEFLQLVESLRRVEALHARTDVAGERDAAAVAMNAIRARLTRYQQRDPPVEYQFSLQDPWSRRLFTALLRRYDLAPYRYRGQRYTTVMVRVPKSFVDDTLWPEYLELDKILRKYLSDVTDRVIRTAIFEDNSEADQRDAPSALEHRPQPK